MDSAYLDTETTDINPGSIIQLSYIVESEGSVVQAKNFFFEVDKIEPGAQKAHGMSVEDVKRLANGNTFQLSHQEILKDLSGTRIIAHNEPFDERFISSEFWRCGVSFQPADKFCTMQYWKDVLKIPAPVKALRYGPYKSPKLEEVTNLLGVSQSKVLAYSKELFGDFESGFHDSRFDTTAMFVAVNIQRDIIQGTTAWRAAFSM